ncbi:MAG: Smr/MutS family protein [Acidobacteriota bacterium]
MTDKPVEVPIEDWIDLHTFPPPEIKSLVEEYLYQAVLRGYNQVRIIHGRGIGVQREIVRKLLSRNPAVAAFEDAPDRGATVVYLKHPGSVTG